MFFLFWPVFDPELVLCLISGKTLIWKITMYDVNHPEGDGSASACDAESCVKGLCCQNIV